MLVTAGHSTLNYTFVMNFVKKTVAVNIKKKSELELKCKPVFPYKEV